MYYDVPVFFFKPELFDFSSLLEVATGVFLPTWLAHGIYLLASIYLSIYLSIHFFKRVRGVLVGVFDISISGSKEELWLP